MGGPAAATTGGARGAHSAYSDFGPLISIPGDLFVPVSAQQSVVTSLKPFAPGMVTVTPEFISNSC